MGKFLIAIISIALFVRLFNLSSNPIELFSDEITHVLSARTILETGKDVNGELNLFLYNKIKLGTPIYGYVSALSTYIFGDNAFAIRLPAVVAGVITVLLIYKLCFVITKDKAAALSSAFSASLTPWLIYFSRIAWEPALTAPFLLGSILLFINDSLFSYVLFAMSVYASDAAEFLSPLFLIILIGLNFKKVWLNKSRHLLGLFMFVTLLIPLFYVSATNLLKHERSIKISTFNEGINKKTLGIFISNYLAHFSPNFLFQSGDPNLRHGTGQDGVLYWSFLPFILIGVAHAIRGVGRKHYALLIIWLLIFPLGGSLTNDGVPHATRTLIGAPIFIIFTTLGFWVATKNKKYVGVVTLIFIISTVLQFVIFSRSYFVNYPVRSQPWWEYGQNQVFNALKKHSTGSETVCLSNIDYWHEQTLIGYYLGVNNNYNIVYDLENPNCLVSEILVLPPQVLPTSEYVLLETIYSLEYNPTWMF